MKKALLPLAFAVIGFALGLLCQPYRIFPVKLGDAETLVKCNRLTGQCWTASPYGEFQQWKTVRHP